MQTTPGTSLTDDTSPSPTSRRSHRVLWAAVALAVLVADQVTKTWAEHQLSDLEPREVLGDWLQLRLTYNPGAAFSMGTGYTALLTVIALGVVFVVLRLSRNLGSVAWAVALGLLLGGALGNITDRLFRDPGPFRGHVVDFIELPSWPVFNLADSAICAAAVLFVLLTMLGVPLHGRAPEESADEPVEP
jgi:signal peptidase II